MHMHMERGTLLDEAASARLWVQGTGYMLLDEAHAARQRTLLDEAHAARQRTLLDEAPGTGYVVQGSQLDEALLLESMRHSMRPGEHSMKHGGTSGGMRGSMGGGMIPAVGAPPLGGGNRVQGAGGAQVGSGRAGDGPDGAPSLSGGSFYHGDGGCSAAGGLASAASAGECTPGKVHTWIVEVLAPLTSGL